MTVCNRDHDHPSHGGAGLLISSTYLKTGGVHPPGTTLYLVQKRGAGVKNPLTWDTSAAGALEPGEKFLDGALRESREELGPLPDLEVDGNPVCVISHGNGWEFHLFHAMAATPFPPFIARPEVADWAWVPASQFKGLNLNPGFREELIAMHLLEE